MRSSGDSDAIEAISLEKTGWVEVTRIRINFVVAALTFAGGRPQQVARARKLIRAVLGFWDTADNAITMS